MPKLIDLTGQKFGKLIVLKQAPNKNNIVYWECKCDCGNTVIVSGQNLRRGNTKSCGCLKKELLTKQKTIDLTGQIFGELTVIKKAAKEEISTNDTHAYWWVQCSCGAPMFTVSGKSLREGRTKSCGHLRYEIGKNKIKDLTGEKFGKLKVLNFVEVKNHKAIWHCKCECGNEKT